MRRTLKSSCVLVALFVTAILGSGCCPWVNYDYSAEAQRTGAYRVGEGDVLRVAVWGDNQLSGTSTVRPDGQITLPLIGDVEAGGRTPPEIQEDIARRLVSYVTDRPRVTVTVVEINSYRVYVVGRVNQPGEFTPNSPVTVLQALALARGLDEFADPDSIIIVRRDENGVRRIPFIFCQAVQRGHVEMDITLMTGDTVVVP